MEYIKEMLQEAGLSKTEASEIARENKSFAAWLKKAVCAMDAVSVINREANLANAGFVEYSETLDDMDICREHIEKILELTEDILGSKEKLPNLPDMRKVWINQINLLCAVADDIIKNKPTPELYRYLTHEYPFISTEWPCNRDGSIRASVSDRVRLNYGEAYAYIHLDERLRPTGEVTWDTEEMGVSDEASSNAEMTKTELKAMSEKQAHAMAECIDENYYSTKDETPVEYKPFSEYKILLEGGNARICAEDNFKISG